MDEDCDGKKIFLCADVFPAENDDPVTNGCTYIKKGKLSLFTGFQQSASFRYLMMADCNNIIRNKETNPNHFSLVKLNLNS